MGVFTWTGVRRGARRAGRMLAAASLVVPVLWAPIVAAQQGRFHAPRWFRVEWEARVGPNERDVITGAIENGYAFRVGRVRLVVELLDPSGAVVEEHFGWVIGDIAPGARTPFWLTVPRASGYRVSVHSFDITGQGAP